MAVFFQPGTRSWHPPPRAAHAERGVWLRGGCHVLSSLTKGGYFPLKTPSPGLPPKHHTNFISSFRFTRLHRNGSAPEQHTQRDPSVPDVRRGGRGLYLAVQAGAEAAAVGRVRKHPPGTKRRLRARVKVARALQSVKFPTVTERI